MRTHARVVRRMLKDAGFREILTTRDDGSAPFIVASWNDVMKDVSDGIARMGLPVSLVLPLGDSDLWLFTLRSAAVHPAFVQEWDAKAELGEFIKHVWELGTVAIEITDTATLAPTTTQLELELRLAS